MDAVVAEDGRDGVPSSHWGKVPSKRPAAMSVLMEAVGSFERFDAEKTGSGAWNAPRPQTPVDPSFIPH